MNKNPPKDSKKDNPGGLLVRKVFSKRKRSFARALNEVLYQISHDKVVREILQDRCTAQYIADRVCEIFEQCIDNEREAFITNLLKKLQMIENVYFSKHVDALKLIGQKLLSVTNEQNKDEKYHMKQITTLRDQVRALQEQIKYLHVVEAEKVANIAELEEKPEDPNRKDSHFYAYVDITEMSTKMKLLATEVGSLKEVYLIFFKNIMQIHKILKSRLKKKVAAIAKSKADDLAEIQKQKDICKNMKDNYDNVIIPSLKKEMGEALKKSASQNNKLKKEIDALRDELATTKAQYQQKISETEMLKGTIQLLEERNKDTETQMHETEKELRRLQQQLKDLEQQNHTKDEQINKLMADKAALSRDVESMKQKNSRLAKTNTDMEAEMRNLKEELQRYKHQIPLIQDENATLKDSLKEVNDKLEEMKNKNAELLSQINTLTPQLDIANQQLDHMKEKFSKLNDEHESLQKQSVKKQEALLNNGKQIAKLETELENIKQQLKNSEEKNAELQRQNRNLTEQNMQLQEKIKKLTSENQQLQKDQLESQMTIGRQKTKIEGLTDANDRLMQKQNELESTNNKLNNELRKTTKELEKTKNELKETQDQNNNNAQKLRQAEKDIDKLTNDFEKTKKNLQEVTNKAETEKRNSDDMKTLNDTLKAQNNVLKDENDSMKKKLVDYDQLQQNLKELTEKNKLLSDQLRDVTKQMHELADVARDAKEIVDEVSKHIQIKNPSELGKILADMKEKSQIAGKILDALAVENVNDALAHIKEMKKSSDILSKIAAAMPGVSVTDIASKIAELVNENHRLNTEQKRILGMLSADPNIDISKTIQSLIENQRKSAEEITKAADFISDVMDIISGTKTGEGTVASTKLVFPMQEIEQQKLMDIVTRIKKRSDTDHQTVERIIEHARQFGYSGYDAVEAANVITSRSGTTEAASFANQPMIVSPTAAQTEILKQKKQISTLRESLSKHMEMSAAREEELMKENTKLQDEIKEDKMIHAEIGKIWTTGNADMAMLKSKLNEAEYLLIEYAQQMKTKQSA